MLLQEQRIIIMLSFLRRSFRRYDELQQQQSLLLSFLSSCNYGNEMGHYKRRRWVFSVLCEENENERNDGMSVWKNRRRSSILCTFINEIFFSHSDNVLASQSNYKSCSFLYNVLYLSCIVLLLLPLSREQKVCNKWSMSQKNITLLFFHSCVTMLYWRRVEGWAETTDYKWRETVETVSLNALSARGMNPEAPRGQGRR